MPVRKLRVLPAHTALVPDFEAQEAGLRRFIGRRFDSEHGQDEGAAGGFIPTGEPVEVPFRAEYVQEIKDGCLLPADEETARLAGVPWPAKAVT